MRERPSLSPVGRPAPARTRPATHPEPRGLVPTRSTADGVANLEPGATTRRQKAIESAPH